MALFISRIGIYFALLEVTFSIMSKFLDQHFGSAKFAFLLKIRQILDELKLRREVKHHAVQVFAYWSFFAYASIFQTKNYL